MKSPFLILIYLLLSLDVAAQEPEITPEKYFLEHNLCIDSSHTPFLYYNVYDWLGTKYKYSGNSSEGIDCSGFVSMVYQNVFCVDLSGSASRIYSLSSAIEKSELKEGDLLFFKINKEHVSHVGLYLGNNKFAHATTKAGVIISDLDEVYYQKYFYKAGRVECPSPNHPQ